MAKGDIAFPHGDDYGPFVFVREYPLGAGATFAPGEPVFLNTSGDLVETGDDVSAASFLGIALGSGDTVGASDPVGRFLSGPLGQRQQTAAGTLLPVAGNLVPVAVCMPGTVLQFTKFATDGAGTLVTPTKANAVGEQAGLTLDGSGNYVIDVGVTAANEWLRIDRLLDANKVDIARSGKAAVYIEAVVRQNQFSTVPA